MVINNSILKTDKTITIRTTILTLSLLYSLDIVSVRRLRWSSG
jgi:hypothetical protein